MLGEKMKRREAYIRHDCVGVARQLSDWHKGEAVTCLPPSDGGQLEAAGLGSYMVWDSCGSAASI
jgi:hypothetical protein